jgi:hypothetical protein
MRGSATVFMAAPATTIWDLIAEVTNTGRFSPETFDAEWLDGGSGPALGARFRGHVKRNEIGPVYWTTCRVTACERGHEFGFEVILGSASVNNWHYRLVAGDGGTKVTESFRTPEPLLLRPLTFLGEPRRRRNIRDMTTTLQRIKAEVERH